MSRTLHLTTPLMRGPDVFAAQRLLAQHGYAPGAIDGQYGPNTAEAAHRAKWRLGYPSKDVNGNCGSYLIALLKGTRPRTPAMILRARSRQPTARQKALAKAKTYIGTKESPPGSNNVLFSRWYGIQGPWCAMFVSYCFTAVGRRLHYAYVPFILGDARARKNGLSVVLTPEPGDLVLYNWEPGRNQTPDHVGIFERWTGNGTFTAIEGNTGLGSDSNGGEVMRRTRTHDLVEAFVRVG